MAYAQDNVAQLTVEELTAEELDNLYGPLDSQRVEKALEFLDQHIPDNNEFQFDILKDPVPFWQLHQDHHDHQAFLPLAAASASSPDEMVTPTEASWSTSPPEATAMMQPQPAFVNPAELMISYQPAAVAVQPILTVQPTTIAVQPVVATQPTFPEQPASNTHPTAQRRGRRPIIGRKPGETEREYKNRMNKRNQRARDAQNGTIRSHR